MSYSGSKRRRTPVCTFPTHGQRKELKTKLDAVQRQLVDLTQRETQYREALEALDTIDTIELNKNPALILVTLCDEPLHPTMKQYLDANFQRELDDDGDPLKIKLQLPVTMSAWVEELSLKTGVQFCGAFWHETFHAYLTPSTFCTVIPFGARPFTIHSNEKWNAQIKVPDSVVDDFFKSITIRDFAEFIKSRHGILMTDDEDADDFFGENGPPTYTHTFSVHYWRRNQVSE